LEVPRLAPDESVAAQAGHTRPLAHTFLFRFLLARVVVNNGLAVDYRILTEDGMGDIIVFAFVA
jgi:endonuclease YncB( thermonuclease family)